VKKSTVNRYERDLRRKDLARWMIDQHAKTGTIARWTGLSRYRIQQLSRRAEAALDPRRRGISPRQLAYFQQSALLESESLGFAFIAFELQVIPETEWPEAERSLPELSRGERLKAAFELYQSFVPDARISLERAVLLVLEFATRRNLGLSRCAGCGDAMVLERFGTQHRICPFCRQESEPESPTAQTEERLAGARPIP